MTQIKPVWDLEASDVFLNPYLASKMSGFSVCKMMDLRRVGF